MWGPCSGSGCQDAQGPGHSRQTGKGDGPVPANIWKTQKRAHVPSSLQPEAFRVQVSVKPAWTHAGAAESLPASVPENEGMGKHTTESSKTPHLTVHLIPLYVCCLTPQ